MFKINLHLCLFLTLNCFRYGTSVNYSPFNNKQVHLLQATNSDNVQQIASNDYYSAYQTNLQGNSNYPQLYRYYYPPPYQQQQEQLQPQRSTQVWSGPPIVVEDDAQQKQQPSTNIPPTFYQQHSGSSVSRSSELLPFQHRNSKVLQPTAFNPQPTIRTTQFNYSNNNNNNIVYHRDFRHQVDDIPESQRAQQGIVSWNNQQQQQQQHQILEQQRPQQFYATNTNLHYNGISNYLTSLRKETVPDYSEHFKRYLATNPRRIKPIY